MPNSDVGLTRTYHNATKHSLSSLQANQHYLDWDNQPLPFKIYTTVDPIPLPQDAEFTGVSALSAIAGSGLEPDGEKFPALKDLARILFFSAGITKKKTYPGGEMYFRAASCTGALYEFELYLVCGDLPDLKAGLYHFGPGDFSLRLLRPGDHRGVLVNATGGEPRVAHAPVTIVCAGTYWRNSWKYQARTYRHFGWDNGTMLANMLAMTNALQFPAKVVAGFVDAEVNRLLDLNPEREVAFSMVPIGYANAPPPDAPRDIPALDLPTVPLSKRDVDYPEMREMHEGSSLGSGEEAREWRDFGIRIPDFGFGGQRFPKSEIRIPNSEISIEQVILRRGSSRQFQRQPITLEQLSTMLRSSTQGIPADFLEPFGAQLNDLYLIINAVEGLQPGAYVYHRDSEEFELLKEGEFRREARYLGLQQDLPGDAAADVFFLADLEAILGRFGNRGYRAVQLESGIIGGKLYLAAYAQRLGATGLTFFDDDVVNFFSPHASGKSTIFLVALGKGRKVT
jgi:SagB-type dehydrogenase family enzyme